jgi:hypothetical protein
MLKRQSNEIFNSLFSLYVRLILVPIDMPTSDLDFIEFFEVIRIGNRYKKVDTPLSMTAGSTKISLRQTHVLTLLKLYGARCSLCIIDFLLHSFFKDRGVEASATRGTTALVYSLINSSLYTRTVQRWRSTPNWLDGHQGCSQLSTGVSFKTILTTPRCQQWFPTLNDAGSSDSL